MSKIIDKQIRENKEKYGKYATFFGGKDGFDYICFDNHGTIMCSGKLENMLEYAEKNGWAVAILVPIKFKEI